MNCIFCAVLLSGVRATFWLGIEQCSNQRWTNPVPDLHDTYGIPEIGTRKWSWFIAPVSGACVMDIKSVKGQVQ